MVSDRKKHLPAAAVCALLLTAAGLAGCTNQEEEAARLTGGDPARGVVYIRKYGCAACHTIPGIEGARGMVGPPLTGIAARTYLGGQLPNTPDNMMRWIENPQGIERGTAMPNLGVSHDEARHIAAYLYTLR
jgi:cytochrome c2